MRALILWISHWVRWTHYVCTMAYHQGNHGLAHCHWIIVTRKLDIANKMNWNYLVFICHQRIWKLSTIFNWTKYKCIRGLNVGNVWVCIFKPIAHWSIEVWKKKNGTEVEKNENVYVNDISIIIGWNKLKWIQKNQFIVTYMIIHLFQTMSCYIVPDPYLDIVCIYVEIHEFKLFDGRAMFWIMTSEF